MVALSENQELDTSLCRNCGSSSEAQPSTLFRDKDITPHCCLTQCGVCAGHSFISGDTFELQSIYSRKYFHGAEYYDYDASVPSFKKNFQRKIKIIRDSTELPTELRVLEVGGATGEFFAALTQNNSPLQLSDYLSIEVSEYARERANNRGARSISPFDPKTAEAIILLRPNLIVAWDVWEHLENPSEVFANYLSYAEAKVILAITTVDSGALIPRIRGASWRQFHPPTHLNYPTRTSFKKFFDLHQLSTLYHRSFGSFRPLGEYTKMLPSIINKMLPQSYRTLPLYCNTFDTQLVIGQRELPGGTGYDT